MKILKEVIIIPIFMISIGLGLMLAFVEAKPTNNIEEVHLKYIKTQEGVECVSYNGGLSCNWIKYTFEQEQNK